MVSLGITSLRQGNFSLGGVHQRAADVHQGVGGHPGGVPVFWRRQVLVKGRLGPCASPSGTVTSTTNSARSFRGKVVSTVATSGGGRPAGWGWGCPVSGLGRDSEEGVVVGVSEYGRAASGGLGGLRGGGEQGVGMALVEVSGAGIGGAESAEDWRDVA